MHQLSAANRLERYRIALNGDETMYAYKVLAPGEGLRLQSGPGRDLSSLNSPAKIPVEPSTISLSRLPPEAPPCMFTTSKRKPFMS